MHSQQAQIGCEILISLTLLFIIMMQWGSLSSADTPIKVPREPMEVLHIGFTEVNGRFVMTVVDRFWKKGLSWFVLLAATDAESVAEAFFSKIITQWRLPRAIICDRDARFTGKFWRELMSLYGCEMLFSTVFHPQTDGMAEVTNITLKKLLLFCAEEEDWKEKLP